jgi:hypothetical protein
VQNSVQWPGLVNMVVQIRVPKKVANSLDSSATFGYSRTLFHVVTYTVPYPLSEMLGSEKVSDFGIPILYTFIIHKN